jgi:hypothetical protein
MKRRTLSDLLHKLEEAQSDNNANIVSLNEALLKNMGGAVLPTRNDHCHSGYNSSCTNSHCSGTSNGGCTNTSCLV